MGVAEVGQDDGFAVSVAEITVQGKGLPVASESVFVLAEVVVGVAETIQRFGYAHPVIEVVEGETMKGYQTGGDHGLADAWGRYLPKQPTALSYPGYLGYLPGQAVTDPNPVTDAAVTADSSVTPLTRRVTAVTAVTAPASHTTGRPRL